MESVDLLKLLGSGGFAVALLWLLRWWMIQQVAAMAKIVDSVANVGRIIDEHTAIDVAHHAEVRESVVRLEGKIDGAADERARSGLTPIEGVPIARTPTRAQSEPGVYGVRAGRKL